MSIPCGIFWDYGNIEIPRKSSADIVEDLIRSEIIEGYDLVRRDFYVVGDNRTIKEETIDKLRAIGAIYENAIGKNAADVKIVTRMMNFIDRFDHKCTIILITGDNDFEKALRHILPSSLLKIYFIRLEYSFGEKLEKIADRIFLLKSNSLELVYPKPRIELQSGLELQPYLLEFQKKYFVMVESDRYFSPKLIDKIRNDLIVYGGSFAVLDGDDIWCAFDEISAARSALNLSGTYSFQSRQFTIVSSLKPSPPKQVINLMICAKLSYHSLISSQLNEELKMPQYKVNPYSSDRRTSGNQRIEHANDWNEMVNNLSETYSNVQSVYSTLMSPNTGTNPRPSNSRSNDEGCRLS